MEHRMLEKIFNLILQVFMKAGKWMMFTAGLVSFLYPEGVNKLYDPKMVSITCLLISLFCQREDREDEK